MASISQEALIYTEAFEKPLDEKRRMTVPSKWRFSGDDCADSYLALPNPNGSISVYPPERAKDFKEKTSKVGMGNPGKQRALMRLLSKADSFGLDKQGRLVISEKLMLHANIERSIIAAGMGDHFQIWNPQEYAAFVADSADSQDDIQLLDDLGI